MRVKEMIKNQGTFKTMLGLAVVALLLISCDSGSKGNDPQVEDSSSSVTDPTSSGSVIASSGSVITSSSSAKSSSSTQINSSGSTVKSSGSTGNSSSSFVSSSSGEADCTWQCVDACEGTVIWSTPTKQAICQSGEWVELSSSSSVKSSSSRGNMSGAFNSNLSYGKFTDPRDNRTYKTIIIGYFQYEYFAENLNYGKQISGSTEQTDSTKYCYNDDPWYCESHYGGLYRWSVAMGFPRACDTVALGSGPSCPDTIALPTGYQEPQFYPQHQGLCPDGWHVMNEGEWGNILGGGPPRSSPVRGRATITRASRSLRAASVSRTAVSIASKPRPMCGCRKNGPRMPRKREPFLFPPIIMTTPMTEGTRLCPFPCAV